jgi:hypothetical protein
MANILSALLSTTAGRSTLAFVVDQAITLADAFKVPHRIEVLDGGLLVTPTSEPNTVAVERAIYVESDSDDSDVLVRLSVLVYQVSVTVKARMTIVLTDDERDLARNGLKINAIKAVRDRIYRATGVTPSLRDAKDAVDAVA